MKNGVRSGYQPPNLRQCENIGGVPRPKILSLASEVIEACLKIKNKNRREDQEGGKFTILSSKELKVILHEAVGFFLPEKKDRYENLSKEKALRLAKTPEHKSSYQSRDPNTNKWGGAIRANGFILSFSGLPEKEDEACMIALALHLEWIDDEYAKKIASFSKNWALVQKIIEKFGRK